MADSDLNLSDWLSPGVLDKAGELAVEFAQAKPFRHVVIDHFFTPDYCQSLIREFPKFDEKLAINENGEVGAKAVREQIKDIGPEFKKLHELSKSDMFRGLIGRITGIADLQHDPYYFGGGTHENRQGQGLDAHVDFNYHPVTHQHRRLNLIVYLNEEWNDEWGGALQLHRDPYLPPSQDDIKFVSPLANRCVIFETNEYSWHGFKRIDLPSDKQHLSRKSFAIYYYTDTRPEAETGAKHSTIYVEQHLPEDFYAGMVLDGERLQQVRNLLATRDQHLKRLYGDIMRLNDEIDDLRHQVDAPQAAEPVSSGSETEASSPETTQEPDVSKDPENAEHIAELQKLFGQLRHTRQRVREFETSTSWRITAPIRALKRVFTRKP